MFFNLTDLILKSTEEEEQDKKQPLCAPRDRTYFKESREAIWNVFEKPETSSLAKIVNFVSIFFILLSTVSHSIPLTAPLNLKIIDHLRRP